MERNFSETRKEILRDAETAANYLSLALSPAQPPPGVSFAGAGWTRPENWSMVIPSAIWRNRHGRR